MLNLKLIKTTKYITILCMFVSKKNKYCCKINWYIYHSIQILNQNNNKKKKQKMSIYITNFSLNYYSRYSFSIHFSSFEIFFFCAWEFISNKGMYSTYHTHYFITYYLLLNIGTLQAYQLHIVYVYHIRYITIYYSSWIYKNIIYLYFIKIIFGIILSLQQ